MSTSKIKKAKTIAKSGFRRPRSPETREKILKAAYDTKSDFKNPEVAFPDTGSVKDDFREQMQKVVKLMNSPRGEVVANVIGCGQADEQLIAAFRDNWLTPRREDAKRIFKRGVERGELREGIDEEIAIDALYSPLFYRLLLKHQPLTDEFVEKLVDVVIGGLKIKK